MMMMIERKMHGLRANKEEHENRPVLFFSKQNPLKTKSDQTLDPRCDRGPTACIMVWPDGYQGVSKYDYM